MQEDLAPNDAPLEGTMVCTLKLGHSLLTLDQDIDVIEPTVSVAATVPLWTTQHFPLGP